MYNYIHISLYIYSIFIYIHAAVSNGKQKMEAQVIFLILFTICSSYKRKFVVGPFVYEETHGSYSFANGLNGLAHPWKYVLS
jgi:hypothetical protein